MILNRIISRRIILIVGVVIIMILAAAIIWYDPINEYVRQMRSPRAADEYYLGSGCRGDMIC
ncbi:hypothetical protein HY624_02485 [Candidatus Uhrbacteria bacterium]|nr:hypothetical protein [Candidatus Uhrbacteria bacterium]